MTNDIVIEKKVKLVITHQNPQKGIKPKYIDFYLDQKATFLIQLSDRKTLEYMVSSGTKYIGLIFGLALTHPKDNYNKKTGRETAHKNLNMEVFDLTHVDFREFNRTVFHFTGVVRNKSVNFAMSFVPNKEPRLEYIYL